MRTTEDGNQVAVLGSIHVSVVLTFLLECDLQCNSRSGDLGVQLLCLPLVPAQCALLVLALNPYACTVDPGAYAALAACRCRAAYYRI